MKKALSILFVLSLVTGNASVGGSGTLFLPENQVPIQLSIDFVDQPPMKRSFWFFGRRKLRVRATVSNTSSSSIYVEKPIANATIRFLVKDEHGNFPDSNIPNIVEPKIDSDYYRKLESSDRYSMEVDLYSLDDLRLKKGHTYRITAIYNAGNGGYLEFQGVPLFQGKVTSNEISLEL